MNENDSKRYIASFLKWATADGEAEMIQPVASIIRPRRVDQLEAMPLDDKAGLSFARACAK